MLIGVRRRARQAVPVLLWFAVPLVALSLMARKRFDYAAPVLPAVALLAAIGWSGFRGRWIRGLLITVFTVVGVLQCVAYLPGENHQPPTREAMAWVRGVNAAVAEAVEESLAFNIRGPLVYSPYYPTTERILAKSVASLTGGQQSTVLVLSSLDIVVMQFRYWTIMNDPACHVRHLNEFTLMELLDPETSVDCVVSVLPYSRQHKPLERTEVLRIERRFRELVSGPLPPEYATWSQTFLDRVRAGEFVFSQDAVTFERILTKVYVHNISGTISHLPTRSAAHHGVS